MTSAGSIDVLFASFNGQGVGVGAARYGDLQYQYALQIAADNLDAPVVAGTLIGSLDFGLGGTISAAGNKQEVFVAKLSP